MVNLVEQALGQESGCTIQTLISVKVILTN